MAELIVAAISTFSLPETSNFTSLHRRSMMAGMQMNENNKKQMNYVFPEYSPQPGFQYMAPKPLDFSDKHMIRHVPYAPLDWIQMMGLDPVQVRTYEIRQQHVIDRYNNMNEYTSAAALCNWQKYNKLDRFDPSKY